MTTPSQPKRTLLTALREHYFDPSRNKLANDPRWKYGMLALLLFLLAGSIWISFTIRQPNPARYLGLVVSNSLLLNHLSAYFHFGPRYTFPFRLFATIFTLAGVGYLLVALAK
ncbi:hypothetical protein DB345_02610 [Spartobacteria bacterium LR76]|nr:hypothetical protein DB345_02610 [Spartobacteria bacterium LR76]